MAGLNCSSIFRPQDLRSTFVSSLDTTTPHEKDELSAKILLLFDSGQIEQIEKIVTVHWIVFPELAEPIRDNDRIAFAAVSSSMQIGYAMSERLRRDISFFIRAFNAYNAFRNIEPVSITSPRDLFFVLQFSVDCCYHHPLIGETEVSKQIYPLTLEGELAAATALKEQIYSLDSWSDMGAHNKDACVTLFKTRAPGFADFSYLYAYVWLSRNMTFNAVFG